MNKEKKNILSNGAVQTLLASLFCILLGLVVGYIVLLAINPAGAGRAITAILQNFLYFPRPEVALEYFGSTLAKTAPLLMCTLSVLFAYKVGLFNIGASGQYSVGAGLALYFGIHYNAPWWVCLILAMLGGAVLGAVAGALKAYLNVNEVIACIMLNWISMYAVNTVLTEVKESGTTYTLPLRTNNPNALIPHLGLQHLFADNRYVTIAIPLAVIFAILVWVILDKTKLGYELKDATVDMLGRARLHQCCKVCRYEREEKHYSYNGNFRCTCRTGSRIPVLMRNRAVVLCTDSSSEYGIQRNRSGIPWWYPSNRCYFFFILYPAYHQWWCICR